jgi:hypothetical protein
VLKTALVGGLDGVEGLANAPGTVLSWEGEALLVQCGDRPPRILRYHPEPA